MENLRELENFQVPIMSDEDGYVGRECPQDDCEGYFKVKFGTGIQEPIPCTCPYCGYEADHSGFMTKDQNEYIKSYVMSKITGALEKDFSQWTRNMNRKNQNDFFSINFQFKARKIPIRYYNEKDLETKIICEDCDLYYSIYGIFSFCPDCKTHNSLQILKKNFEIAEKEICLSESIDNSELAETLLSDSLENVVSSFDAFSREFLKVKAEELSLPGAAGNISFQNPVGADRNINQYFNIDLQSIFSSNWTFIIKCFQKRHLFAHKMGVVDEQYLNKTNDNEAILNRKIQLSTKEIRDLMDVLIEIGNYLHQNV